MTNILCATIGHNYMDPRYDYVFVCSRCGRVLVWADSERWNSVGSDGKATFVHSVTQSPAPIVTEARTLTYSGYLPGVTHACACGCGQPVKPGNRYINRHNLRSPWRSKAARRRARRLTKVQAEEQGG